MKHWLPEKDFDISNLTRRQAAVFEHICQQARMGIKRQIGMHEMSIALPFASSNVVAEHRIALRGARYELDRVIALQNRLTRVRTAPLTDEERDRLAEARAAKPDLTAKEADAAIYGIAIDLPSDARRKAA